MHTHAYGADYYLDEERFKREMAEAQAKHPMNISEALKIHEQVTRPTVMFGDGSGQIATFHCEHEWIKLGTGETCVKCTVIRREPEMRYRDKSGATHTGWIDDEGNGNARIDFVIKG